MTKLEQLIQELCPDGVPFYELREVFDMKNGYTPSKANASFWENGTIPWFRMEDIRENGRILSDSLQHITPDAVKGNLFPANSIIVATSATIGEHALITVKSLANQRFTCLTPNKEYIDRITPKYIYYYCFKLDEWCLNNTNISSFASVDMAKFARFKIPLPPLPVQQEIVRILDSFTELTAELTARRKQYEYYIYRLLYFNDTVKTHRLGDLADFRNGKGHEKDIVSDGKYIVVNSKFISMNGEIKKYSDKQICPLYIDDVLMVMSDLPNGRALAKCYLVTENDKYTLNQRIGAFHIKNENAIITKFLLYVLNRNQQLLRYDNGVDQTNLRKDDILNIMIPVPSIEEQRCIVSILDRFDALCNDLTSGLPAEIEARQKQYEYYRDKLLKFKSLSRNS